MNAPRETARLVLRPFVPEDRDALAALHANSEFWWFPLRRAQTEAEADAFLQRRLAARDLWAAVEKARGVLVGWAGLSVPDFLPEILPAVEVGWRFNPGVWGRGYATEAGAAALAHGFDDLGLDRIVSICEPDNVASVRVMEKLGMHLERETTHPRLRLPLQVRVIDARAWHRGAGSRDGLDGQAPPGNTRTS